MRADLEKVGDADLSCLSANKCAIDPKYSPAPLLLLFLRKVVSDVMSERLNNFRRGTS